MYLDKFVKREGCIFDILVWIKTNPIPIYNNHYLKDKEYCLYFRGKEGAYCRPPSVDMAKTYSFQEINAKDKKMYNHPTIKPINMIAKSIINSSREGDTILDPFMGSGTSGVACVRNNRNFIGMEINQTFFNLAKQRIENEQKTLRLF